MSDLYEKLADLQTPLLPHQQRVIDKLRASGGLLVQHGVGAGKTLSSIAASDQLGVPIDAITPAPLVPNYHKELIKHLGAVPDDTRVRSYEKAVREKSVNPNALVVMDEAHRARNPGTAISKEIAQRASQAKYRMLLTGTAIYNQPEDLSSLLNTAAGHEVVPSDPRKFREQFIGYRDPEIPLWDQIKGVALGHKMKAPAEPHLIRRNELINAAHGYVDVHKGGGKDFPRRVDETHHVPMSPKQHELYRFYQGTMPWYLKAKIESGIPLDKREAQQLNAFQGALRQVSNTPESYLEKSRLKEDPNVHAPKIQMVVDHLKDMQANTPNHRGVIYSNYLGSGLLPVSRALEAAGIPHHVFTGALGARERKSMVEDYNSGHVPVLLISGAGAEGLDLKGTKSIQVMEPHWNAARIDQVIGRGIRYKSHEHLPEEEREVKVMRYYATLPQGLLERAGQAMGMPQKRSIEQYLQMVSDDKARLAREINQALQEASDRGPLPLSRKPR